MRENGGGRPLSRKHSFMPGYGGCVQHEYNKIAATFGKAAQASYIEALNLKHHPPTGLKVEETYTANDYYAGAPNPRKKTNSKNRSNMTLGDPRAQTFDTMYMTSYRMRDLPMTRAPLVDGFAEMSCAERDKVYRRALERCGVDGVRKLEHDIRVKIEQRTSGGPFALRKAFKYFDRDGSGDIDPDEFFAAMDWFGLQFTEDGVLGLFGLYDEDRGGSLGYYEFVENLIDGFGKAQPSGEIKNQLAGILRDTQSLADSIKSPSHVNIDQARQAFDFCDTNGSGRIELAELDGILKTLGMNTDSDVVNQAMLVLDKDCSGDVSFEEFWDWWQFSLARSKTGSPKQGRRSRGLGDTGRLSSGASRSSSAMPVHYDKKTLDAMNTGGYRSPALSSNQGRRTAMGFSPYGDAAPPSPMMGARFAQSVKGSHGSTMKFGSTHGSAALQYGDVLSRTPSSAGFIPKWTPPKAGTYIRQP